MKSKGIAETPEQCETPITETAAEKTGDTTATQELSKQPGAPAEDKFESNPPSQAKQFFKEAFQILFGLVVLVALGYFVWSGMKKVYNRYHVKTREHLTEKLDLVQYGNNDYQLRRADRHRKFSERFATDPDYWDHEQYIHFILKNGNEKTVSLNTHNTVTCSRIYCPDRRGIAACVDGHNHLHFVNLHSGKIAYRPRFTILSSDDCIRYKGSFYVISTKNGQCLMDTSGNVLLHGFDRINVWDDRYITTVAGKGKDRKESLYDARDMRCLLADKDEIQLTSVGVYYKEGDQRYLMDSTLTHVITNLVLDDYSDEYDEEYLTIMRFPEPQSPHKDSGYKKFSMNDLCGVFDKDYHVVIEPLWDNVNYLGDGYFACQSRELAVIVNQKGKVLPYRE